MTSPTDERPQLGNPQSFKIMTEVIIVGGGEHAAVVADVLQASGHTVRGIVDDSMTPIACESMQLPRLGDVAWLAVQRPSDPLVMGIGSNEIRIRIAKRLAQLGFQFFSAIHPSAIVSATARIDPGSVIMPRAVVNTNAVVGHHCIINSAAVVEHDSVIGNGSHISVGTILAGRVYVGEGTLIGAGAVVLPHLTIGRHVSIGAGAVVTKSIGDNCVAMGVPARVRTTADEEKKGLPNE